MKKISLTNEQNKALKILKTKIQDKDKVSILQGYAGSGKSYTLQYLMEELNLRRGQAKFCAFTGTAAKVLMNNGLSASTIHKLIYEPIMYRGKCIGFRRKPYEALENLKLIVIDEYSMVSEDLFNDLMYYNVPLLLVGDPAQLPPIGKANPYINQYDAILTEIHRQALNNPILWGATLIREGKLLPQGLHGGKLFVGRRTDLQEDWLRPDVQILCGLNNTRKKLNLQIAGSPIPQPNHKIIFLKNDWNMGITNGTILDLDKIYKIGQQKYVLYFTDEEGIEVENYKAYFQDQLDGKSQYFDYAYAITTHKAQGQTLDSPGLIIDESSWFKEHKKEWLYTALSRFTGNYNVAVLR